MTNILKYLLFSISSLVLIDTSYACPKINNIPDFNCDQKLVVTVLGDSLGSGFGDTKNRNMGGYVLRAKKKFPNVTFINLSKKGLRTFELKSTIESAFNETDETKVNSYKESLLKSDYVFLDLGRNDRWLFIEPNETLQNLTTISKTIKSEVKKLTGLSPLVITPALMLPNRGSQGPWVKALNALITKTNSLEKPADLRFDLVSKRLLASDQIHPTSKGYDELAKKFITYLRVKLSKKVQKLHPDTDTDGIADIFETLKFNTSPLAIDTDSDGTTDYTEIFGS